ncbi:MAG: dihydropteroate synthase [Clostridia bacterium]|nr:dihydropteroate synthase [Clostridia bacterium]
MQEFHYRGGALSLTNTAVMGILNVTPDSFSDGGRFDRPDAALIRAAEIEREGAAILDIGGQSTRPGYTLLSPEEEWARLCPVLTNLTVTIPVSVDTFYPAVAKRAIEAGASIINDVSGDLQNGMIPLAAATGAGLILLHAGDPQDAIAFFDEALQEAAKAGLREEQLCFDIGVGFGKTREQDLESIRNIPRLCQAYPTVPILCGASRKRVVAAAAGTTVPPVERLGGTVALHTAAQLSGARILRAHDVKESVQAATAIDSLMRGGQDA